MGPAHVDAPHFRVREPLLKGHGPKATSGADIEHTSDFAVGRLWTILGCAQVRFVELVTPLIESLGQRPMIDPSGERIAYIAARLGVNFMGGVVGQVHIRIELERAWSGIVCLFHQRQIPVGIPMKGAHGPIPHQGLRTAVEHRMAASKCGSSSRIW